MGVIVPTGKRGIFGDLITQKRARATLPILLIKAQECETITFKQLGSAIGFHEHRFHGPILDCINTELDKLSRNDGWDYGEIPTLTTIVVQEGEIPSNWMSKQMQEQLHMEPTPENYRYYCIQPVHEYEYWDQVMGAIIGSPNW